MDLDPFGGDFVEQATDLSAETLPDLVDVTLGWNSHVERIALLTQKTRRREPGVILRPVNDLLDPAEHLRPGVHGGGGSRYLLEHPQLFHSCGNSGHVGGGRSLAQGSTVARGEKSRRQAGERPLE